MSNPVDTVFSRCKEGAFIVFIVQCGGKQPDKMKTYNILSHHHSDCTQLIRYKSSCGRGYGDEICDGVGAKPVQFRTDEDDLNGYYSVHNPHNSIQPFI